MAAQSEALPTLAKTESGGSFENINTNNILPEKRRRTEETQNAADENKVSFQIVWLSGLPTWWNHKNKLELESAKTRSRANLAVPASCQMSR